MLQLFLSTIIKLGFLHLSGRGKKSVASCEVTDGVKSSAEDCVSSSSPDKRSLAISSCIIKKKKKPQSDYKI